MTLSVYKICSTSVSTSGIGSSYRWLLPSEWLSSIFDHPAGIYPFSIAPYQEDSKGNSLGDAAGLMGDFDLFQTNTNVNNEIQSLQSPAVMLDVVKRLHLDISYHTDGGFYKKVLYGRDCPYTVDFNELQDNESVAFTINPGLDGQVLLTDFLVMVKMWQER